MKQETIAKWELFVDTLILLAIIAFGYQAHPVEAQLANSNGFNFTNITTAANTQAKSAQGILHNIMINGGTLTGTLTVVDTSAANCTGGVPIGVIAANQTAGQNYVYDLQFNNGLCITTAAAVNATVDWR